jgi:hypothetical protein
VADSSQFGAAAPFSAADQELNVSQKVGKIAI